MVSTIIGGDGPPGRPPDTEGRRRSDDGTGSPMGREKSEGLPYVSQTAPR